MVYITAVHMADGNSGHEHIASVRWWNPATRTSGESTRATMVDWINDGGDARVQGDYGDVKVRVVDASPPYIRTHANGVWTDNLLALPRYY